MNNVLLRFALHEGISFLYIVIFHKITFASIAWIFLKQCYLAEIKPIIEFLFWPTVAALEVVLKWFFIWRLIQCAPVFHFHFCLPYQCPKKQATSTAFFTLMLLPWTARQCSVVFIHLSGNTCIFYPKLLSSDSLTLHGRDSSEKKKKSAHVETRTHKFERNLWKQIRCRSGEQTTRCYFVQFF